MSVDITSLLERIRLSRRRGVSKENKEIAKLMQSIRKKNEHTFLVVPNRCDSLSKEKT